MLLLKQSPADQCKCIIHENFISKLKALSIVYDSSAIWNTVLCHNTTSSQCWQGNCGDRVDGKKVIVNINPGNNIFLQKVEIY